jgi:hypothetical protein
MSDTSGRMFGMPFARWDQATRSWRTCEDTCLLDLEMSSLTLPKSGSMRNGQLLQQPTLERPTNENDYLSLPTPHAGLGERGRDGVILNPKGQQDLQHAIAHLLPTPKAAQGGPDATKVRPSGAQGTTNLAGAIKELLPTPMAQEPGYTGPLVDKNGNPVTHLAQRCYDPQTGRLVQTGLTQVAQLLPTPLADKTGGYAQPKTAFQSLPNIAISLLPTPRAGNADPRNIHIYARPLDQPQNLENALARIGDSTSQPSDNGNTSLDDQHQNLQLWDATDDPD